jgi:hypothetical protein
MGSGGWAATNAGSTPVTATSCLMNVVVESLDAGG